MAILLGPDQLEIHVFQIRVGYSTDLIVFLSTIAQVLWHRMESNQIVKYQY